MKKDHFLIIDTETTRNGLVADFGAVVVDRKGTILTSCSALIDGVYTDKDNEPLFHGEGMGELWGKARLPERYAEYDAMLESGSRMLARPIAITRWLDKVKANYKPYLTAYNLAFDVDKCKKTGIDLTMFGANKFCLWHSSVARWGKTKAYRQFILESHAFNAPTKKGNASYKTNAEVMARFVLNQPELEDEPHTAYEDVVFYELPILLKLVKGYSKNKWLNPPGYSWHDYQLKDAYKAI